MISLKPFRDPGAPNATTGPPCNCMAARQGNLHSPLARCATIPKAAKDSAQGEHRSSVVPRWISSQAGIARNVCFYIVFEGFSNKPAPNSSGPHAMSRAPWNCNAAQQADLHSPLVPQWFFAFAFAGQQDPRSAPGAAPDAEGFAAKLDLLHRFIQTLLVINLKLKTKSTSNS